MTAIAGNLDSYYMAGDAALQSGAATADVRGGGAVWYNPAGLGQVQATALDASVNAYSLRLGGHPDFDGGEDARVTRLLSIDFKVVPAALSLVRRIGPVGIGVGVFVPNIQSVYLRTLVTAKPSSGGSTEVPNFGADSFARAQDYHGGLAFGAQVAPRVRVGGALFVNYINQLSISSVGLAYGSADNRVSALGHDTVDWQQVGAQLVLGVQLQLNPTWNIGSAIRFPSIRLYETYQRVSMQSWTLESTSPEVTHDLVFSERTGFSRATIIPARFHFGTSHQVSDGKFALDVNYQVPFRNEEMGLDWKPTFNARVGAQRALDENLNLGLGLFTDRSPTRFTGSLGESDIHFYGISAAVNWVTDYEVRPTRTSTDTTSLLSFGTTLALSYAIGFGDVARGEVTLAGPRGGRLDLISEAVVAHEFTLHLSTSLSKQ